MKYEEYFDARDTGRNGIPRVFVGSTNANLELEAFSAGYLEKYYPN